MSNDHFFMFLKCSIALTLIRGTVIRHSICIRRVFNYDPPLLLNVARSKHYLKRMVDLQCLSVTGSHREILTESVSYLESCTMPLRYRDNFLVHASYRETSSPVIERIYQ